MIILLNNISEIFEFSLDNFYNENGEKYIGEMKNGLKKEKGYYIMKKIISLRERNMRVKLKMISQMEKGLCFGLKGINMKEIGKTIKNKRNSIF